MLSIVWKNANVVIPLSAHALTRNGPGGSNAWYPAAFLATSLWSICPRCRILSIFRSVIFTFTAFPFSFSSHSVTALNSYINVIRISKVL